MATNIFKKLRLQHIVLELDKAELALDAANALRIDGDDLALGDVIATVHRRRQAVLRSIQALDEADDSVVK